jgi:glycosyltransferase involved in cell wall biosynthesis
VLRMPMDLRDYPFRLRQRAKVFLHNAGSLGQAMRKGTDLAISAWQISGLGRKGYTLRIHSFMPCPPELSALIAQDAAGIDWTGSFSQDLRDILAPADVLLHTARAEGDAQVSAEAMACGIPAITPNYAPCNEVAIGHNWTIPVASRTPIPWNPAVQHHHIDVRACAEILQHIAQSDLHQPSRIGRLMVEAQYSLDALRPRWESAILA